MLSRWLLLLTLSWLPGCIFVAEEDADPPAPRSNFTGALVVDWTVNGTTDGDECDQGDASWLRLSVFTSSGRHVADFADACDAFSTSVELDPGSYYADAVLEEDVELPDAGPVAGAGGVEIDPRPFTETHTVLRFAWRGV